MGSLSDYAELELLDHVCNVAYSPVSTIYLCLCTADPTDAATGASMNEVANQYAYARTAISFGSASSRVITQDADVDFPQASGGSWGTASHWAICDNNSYGSGNVLAHGAFDTSKTINDGNSATVDSGEVNVTFSAGYLSDVLAGNLLELMFDNQAYSAPDTYVALTTATISDSDTGSSITEPGAGSYARVQVYPNAGSTPYWTVASSGALDNVQAIDFPDATASWGTVVAMAVCSASSGGDLLFYDNGMSDQAVGDGDSVSFPIGDLDFSLS